MKECKVFIIEKPALMTNERTVLLVLTNEKPSAHSDDGPHSCWDEIAIF